MKKSSCLLGRLLMRHWYSSVLTLIILIVVSGCGPRVKHSSLIKLSNKNSNYVSTKNNVTVRAKKLSQHSIKNLFGSTAAKIASQPIDVVQVCIDNYLDYPVFLLADHVGVNLLSDAYIKSLCHQDLSHYLVKDFLTGIALAGAVAVCSCGPLIVGLVPLGAYCAIAGGSCAGLVALSVPVVSYKTRKPNVQTVNHAIDQAIARTMLIDRIAIPAGVSHDCLLFIARKNYKSKFAITLIDQDNKEIQTFNIKLI